MTLGRGAAPRVSPSDELGRASSASRRSSRIILTAFFAGGALPPARRAGACETLGDQDAVQGIHLKVSTASSSTPDLDAVDTIGTEVIEEESGDGPPHHPASFTALCFANVNPCRPKINRTPPKTQQALLEAMQELPVHGVNGIRYRAGASRSSCSPRQNPNRAGRHGIRSRRRSSSPLHVQPW